ncbi:organic hydroperoxide resistance transcriptional regulator [Sphingomonas mucosissima]|uniref:Organic hydroperoxide resistance transcriptional regulator n=1 Tax=Sphingomonas mucosissima TaxID=370959 RepID=A0A245ZEX5_9SPHN|nr:organic hydroperoxide resistance transcriptional regulator [Sphingomonas mucosissima]
MEENGRRAEGDLTPSDPSGHHDLAAEALRLEWQLCFPLYAASNLLTRLYRPALDDLGLTYPQYLVMLVLWETDGQSVSQIGRRLHLDSGTLTPLLKRMETNGLVARRRDIEDERRVLITLTKEGDALRTAALRVPEKMVANPALTQEEGETLRTIARKLVANLASRSDAAGRS